MEAFNKRQRNNKQDSREVQQAILKQPPGNHAAGGKGRAVLVTMPRNGVPRLFDREGKDNRIIHKRKPGRGRRSDASAGGLAQEDDYVC